ncbi:MAG: histidine phosphatase family protein [Candidatus Marinimicrobia bacterium]|nr:histidine phosphatase family protein [Candidatus Neomarinimicrobiota bacterium]MBL7031260.1 histidine phosphatase family protein [Candidatus Neomarinimicrobiota bacterium]
MNKLKILLLSILLFITGCSSSKPTYTVEDFQCYPKAVYLIRHAEKMIIEGEKNPELTRAGITRAEALPGALADIETGFIYSSEYTRTQQTVAPLSKVWGREISIKTAREPQLQIEAALSHCDQNVVIAGHSNTIPNLISLFGIQEEIAIEDNQYGDLYIIRWQKGIPSLSIEHFGE